MLHRAVAYQVDCPDQPSVHVFFECDPANASAAATLIRLTSLAWGCQPAAIDFTRLLSEPELVAASGLPPTAGDVRWFATGFADGLPTFAAPDRTLLAARPRTVARLMVAQDHCRLWGAWTAARAELADRAAQLRLHDASRKGADERRLQRMYSHAREGTL